MLLDNKLSGSVIADEGEGHTGFTWPCCFGVCLMSLTSLNAETKYEDKFAATSWYGENISTLVVNICLLTEVLFREKLVMVFEWYKKFGKSDFYIS